MAFPHCLPLDYHQEVPGSHVTSASKKAFWVSPVLTSSWGWLWGFPSLGLLTYSPEFLFLLMWHSANQEECSCLLPTAPAVSSLANVACTEGPFPVLRWRSLHLWPQKKMDGRVSVWKLWHGRSCSKLTREKSPHLNCYLFMIFPFPFLKIKNIYFP